MFGHTDVARQLILAAKIHHCDRARLTLFSFLGRATRDLQVKFGLSPTRITPCPSSCWSRMRGKTDLAYLSARQICQRPNTKLNIAPRGLFWKVSKQSQKERKVNFIDSNSYCIEKIDYHPNAYQHLIFDDVCTSGETIVKLHANLGLPNLNALTYTDALRTTTR